MIKFKINGNPVGKARPRVTKWGVHNTEKTMNYETWVKESFVIAHPNHKPLEKALKVHMVVEYPLLKSMTKKQRADALSGDSRPTKKPDCDNIAKIILDALNGIAYVDDKQVVELSITKWYSDVSQVSVRIDEIVG